MRVVDTSAWIEWLMDSNAGARIGPLLPHRSEWIVPTIVQLELARWVTREVGEEKSDAVIAFSEKCRVVDLDSRLALAAAEIGLRHRLATADAIIYATAQAQDADLLTCDAHFEGLENIKFISKSLV